MASAASALHAELIAVDPDYLCVDLKEKFGRAAVTISSTAAEAARNLTVTAWRESGTICEFCGEPGTIRGRSGDLVGWVKTVCDQHVAHRPVS